VVKRPQEPIGILPAVIEPMSEADFEEVTDLLADLIWETIRRNRTRSEQSPTASDKGHEDRPGSHSS
jgi:hypothetical protein